MNYGIVLIGETMYIRKTKVSNKNDYLIYLVEGYRDRDNKVKQCILKSYGYLSELSKDDPNILDKLKTEAVERTLQQIQDTEKIIFLNLKEKRDGTQNLVNYGYIFLESIYNKLNIPSFIENYHMNQRYRYDLNDILKLLVFSRALNPESKKKTYEKKSNYFFELKDFSVHDVYRSLDHLTAIKDDLMVHLNKEIVSQGLRDVSLVFYDVTNYYFESVNFDGFKERGVSKENKDTAIVQMGLFIDNNGIPITYELFPGNTNDLSTMRPILDKIKKDFNLGKITVSTNNLELNPLDIVGHYRKLSKIEESFKITKSDLEGKPIQVWTKPHIEGHFLTCYLALLIYRLLQLKLDNKYPVHRLNESLNQMNTVLFER